jgi:hypothetical protein
LHASQTIGYSRISHFWLYLYEISVGLYGKASMDHKPNLLGLMRQTMRLKHYRMCTERASIEYSALYALPRAAPSGCHGRASRAHFSVTSGRGTPGCRLDPTSSMKRHSVSVTGYRVGPCHRPHHSPGPVGALCAGDGAAWRWGPGVAFLAQQPPCAHTAAPTSAAGGPALGDRCCQGSVRAVPA